jgi:MOSC domain-containing protein
MSHVPLAELESGVDRIRNSPSQDGRVELIVCRPAVGHREVLNVAEVDHLVGVVGDCWRTRGSSSTPDGNFNPDAQITLMNARSVAAIAGERERWQLAGDQFYVDLDLSEANLPPGTRVEVGAAVLEVTALPHRGCGKFLKRFGIDAVKFVNSAVGRELNLRGINARVVQGGTVRTGDAIRKLDVAGDEAEQPAGASAVSEA